MDSRMGLIHRLSVLTPLWPSLVLGSTEIAPPGRTLSTGRSPQRIGRTRRDLGRYITRLAPTGDSTAIAQGLAGGQPAHHHHVRRGVAAGGRPAHARRRERNAHDPIPTSEEYEAIQSNTTDLAGTG
jgi:hypothetical protein